ncbi:hypothetical protein CC78DRAFT_470524 [Lojkania enalia]|uniref:Uncharacterized protein n=1 Tax=Lojkania enalia TaxID=147567 RepID=A0A9P4K392_9PLEO|nr:hypothetical protein CC78DRAFT_470524 [Didymosphaeria enalia]
MTSPISNFNLIAASEAPVAASDGHVNQPKPSATFSAWTEAMEQDVKDGLDGSMEPIALNIPSNVVEKYTLHLLATGICTFPTDYPREVTCQLVGTLKNASEETLSIRSENWQVSLQKGSPSNPPPPEQHKFDFKSFNVDAPFPKMPSPIPFRLAGDFEWTIVDILKIGQPLKYNKEVRLEIVWLSGPPTKGPTVIETNVMQTTTDLFGSHPIGLLRIFLPSLVSLRSDLSFRQSIDDDLQSWWILQASKSLRDKGLVYNTISGKSGFGVGCCGGSFDLEHFLRESFPRSGSSPLDILINSFDLTALMQLACSLLTYPNGDEQLNTRWTCKWPFGYVKPGIPFGLSLTSVPSIPIEGVNNPYFWRTFEPDNSNIEKCNLRSWLEVDLKEMKKGRIVDIAWAVQYSGKQHAEIDLGTKNRNVYAAAHIEDPVGDLSVYSEASPSGSELYKNNEFSTKQSGFEGQIARIGVLDVQGINSPRRETPLARTPTGTPVPIWLPPPLVPVPSMFRGLIDELIDSGKNADTPFWGFNDASLKTMNVKSILTKAIPGLKLESNAQETTLRVVPGASRASYTFTDMPVTASEKGKLVININIFDSLHDSYEALVFELTKYEADISRRNPTRGLPIIAPVDFPDPNIKLGHYALRSPHSILCVRGNLFIEMTIESKFCPLRSSLDEVRNTMHNLDSYLSKHTVARSQLRRPNMAIANAPRPDTYLPEETGFFAQMEDSDTLANTMFAKSSRSSLIVPAKFEKDSFTHRFWVLKNIEAWEIPTTITIAGAHADTFHPGFSTFDVVVANGTTDGTIKV